MTVHATSGRKNILDRFKGALLGCAIGDALGAPVEGMTAMEISSRYGRVTDFLDERFGAGMVTDDTQMTVVLVQAMNEMGRFDRDHAALKFGRWMEASDNGVKPARGVGSACATACRRLYQGTSPDESGVPSAGCGAAMRVSPIGLRYYSDMNEVHACSVEQSTITHTDPEAAAGAAAVAFAVARGVVDEGALDREGLVMDAAEFVSAVSPAMSDRIVGIARYLEEEPAKGFEYTGVGGYVMETVPAALLAFVRTPYFPEDTLVTAVNAGGDTDSIAAIAGAVSGAFNGASALPSRLVERVEGRDYLELLAERLFALTPAARPRPRPFM